MNALKPQKSIFIHALNHFQDWCAKTAALTCASGISAFLGIIGWQFNLSIHPLVGLISLIAITAIGYLVISKVITALILWLDTDKEDKVLPATSILHTTSFFGTGKTSGDSKTDEEPHARGGKIAVLIPRLSGDDDGSTREHIISFILNDIGRDNVEILRSKRLLAWDESASTENQSQRAVEEGRTMLADRGADILIWGRCYKSNNMEMADLHFTTHEKTGEISKRFEVKNMSLDYAFTKELVNNLPKYWLLELTKKYHYEGDVKTLGEQRMRDLYESALGTIPSNDAQRYEVEEAIFSLDEPALLAKADNLERLYKEAEQNFYDKKLREAAQQFTAILNHPDFNVVNENMTKLMIYNRKGWHYSAGMVYFHLRQIYEHGLGVEKDEKRAFQYACLDAEASRAANSTWRVVEMCEKGIGVEINDATIAKWRNRAIELEQTSIGNSLRNADLVADPRYKGDQLVEAKKMCVEALANRHISEAQKEWALKILSKVAELKTQFNISDEAMAA